MDAAGNDLIIAQYQLRMKFRKNSPWQNSGLIHCSRMPPSGHIGLLHPDDLIQRPK